MGACDDVRRVKGTAEELPTWFKELQERLRYDNGHAGYTGTMAEAHGLTIRSEVFEDAKAANEWLQTHFEKWGPALAVRYGKPEGNTWLVGALCSS